MSDNPLSPQTLQRKFVVVSDAKPSSPFEGQIWIDSDGGNTTRQYKNGSFETISSDLSNVYKFMNQAASFHETSSLNQSLNAWNYDDGFIDTFYDTSKIYSNTNTTINTGSSGNSTLSAVNGSSTSLKTDNDSYSMTDTYGLAFSINNSIIGLNLTISSNTSGATKLYVQDSNGNNLQTQDISNKSAGDKVNISYDFNAGNTYHIVMDAEGSTWTFGEDDNNANFPYSSTDFDVVGTSFGDGSTTTSYRRCFNYATALKGYQTSGTITHIRKDLGFTPSKIVVSSDYDSSGTNESIDIDVADNSGNTVNINESEFDTEVPVNFADGNIQVTDNLNSDGSSSPQINDISVLGVQ